MGDQGVRREEREDEGRERARDSGGVGAFWRMEEEEEEEETAFDGFKLREDGMGPDAKRVLRTQANSDSCARSPHSS